MPNTVGTVMITLNLDEEARMTLEELAVRNR